MYITPKFAPRDSGVDILFLEYGIVDINNNGYKIFNITPPPRADVLWIELFSNNRYRKFVISLK